MVDNADATAARTAYASRSAAFPSLDETNLVPLLRTVKELCEEYYGPLLPFLAKWKCSVIGTLMGLFCNTPLS